MSGIYDDNNRQVIPRWYPYKVAMAMGDLLSAKPRRGLGPAASRSLATKIRDWQEERGIPHAIDVVGTALIIENFDHPDIAEAVKFLRERPNNLSSLGRQLIETYVRRGAFDADPELAWVPEVSLHQRTIAGLKAMVSQYPRNAVAWADLAFFYAVLGQNRKAERAMDIAMAIGSEGRFILRAAARCYLHLDAPDKAIHYLRRSRLSRIDPWVVSAEIAISESVGRDSGLIRVGQAMNQDENLSSWSTNELGAALGTLEAKHGKRRKAKRLMSSALADPNENTIAQAEWLSARIGGVARRPPVKVLASYEADAREEYRERRYAEALCHALEWYRFQPYASRPAVFASYVSSVCLRDDLGAIEILRKAQKSSPNSPMLNNNLIFSLASLDMIAEAERVLASMSIANLSQRERCTLLATRGLVDFRKGNVDEGRREYMGAISGLKELGEYRGVAIATLFLAREEMRIGSELADQTLREAIKMGARHNVDEVEVHARWLSEEKTRAGTGP